jgi:hypothetical protein
METMTSPLAISCIIFACVFGGALLGLVLRTVLPAHHLSAESKDLIKLGMGLVGTMAALVLGLLIASAKGSYDTQRNEVVQMSANLILLDRTLAHYGPEAKETRDALRAVVSRILDQLWSSNTSRPAGSEPTSAEGERFFDKVQELSPHSDAQRSMQAQAFNVALAVGQTRLLLFEQRGSSISMPLLVVMIFWLTIISVSFGLVAPPNATVIVTLFVCALSVSGAIFLVLEMDEPFSGLIQISDAPLRNALAHLGR